MSMPGIGMDNELPSRRGVVAEKMTLDDLSAQNADALGVLYAKGTPPALEDLNGTPRGRMLAFVGPLGQRTAFDLLRRFAGARYFPWDGKSFASRSTERGSGINRVRGVGDFFRFETRIGASAMDGRACVILDYDVSPNPWFIRKIHDELRQVGPRLMLGPAMWKTKTTPRLVLWFAIAT